MADSLPENTEFLLFQADNGKITIETRMENETVWLSINKMAELFGVDKSGISRHLKNIFETGELSRNSVVANFATTATDSKVYQVEHYNLNGIISVGYRVNSIRGTQFRKWASERLKEYIIKGFTMNDELELLNRIVTAYLEFVELQALNRLPMYMKDWIQQRFSEK